jgi:hypothetical protein
VAAALALWERRSTEAKITELDAEPDPLARLRTLFTHWPAGPTLTIAP